MSWKHRWPERAPRPQVRKLAAGEREQILAALRDGIQASPILTGLGIRARFLRGRFYLERVWQASEPPVVETLGRLTPLVKRHDLLLEVQKSKNTWYEVKRGTAQEIINAVAADAKGTFHGLGVLDASLRRAGGPNRHEVRAQDNLTFVYAETGQPCTAQETLYYCFGVPIPVIAEPREWYVYHRTPHIVEVSEDQCKILLEFNADSLFGTFGGTCLYAVINGEWNAFTIKPNQSKNIASAIAWLEKRNWRAW